MSWLRGRWKLLLSFFGIAFLILGGLTWATHAALCVEEAQNNAAATARESERIFQIRKERDDNLRLALWRLDSRLSPTVAREESRPYPHYIALHTPFPAMTPGGVACAPGTFYLPSPLMNAEIPDWIKLHFQLDASHGWTSPQVIPEDLQKMLRKQPLELALSNVTGERFDLLASLKERYPAEGIMRTLKALGATAIEAEQDAQRWVELNDLVNWTRSIRAGNSAYNNSLGNNDKNPEQQAGQGGQAVNPPPQRSDDRGNTGRAGFNSGTQPSSQQLDYMYRVVVTNRGRKEGQWTYIIDDNRTNISLGEAFPSKTAVSAQTVEVQLGAMRPVWLPSAEHPEHLMLVRGARVGGKSVYQGFVIDWVKLQWLLLEEIVDLFPEATFAPLPPGEPPHPERAMSTLPVEFNPGNVPQEESITTPEPEPLGWTPLRIGLAFAWGSALIALLAVGIGGGSLVTLSERRIRFVSAVTHELRTPLTTLRLYLDLLSAGLVTDEKQKTEYLHTLNAEADRLHRLIGNVLDFARLEKSRPNIEKQPVVVANLLDQLYRNWHERCLAAGKELVIETPLISETLQTDANMVEQIIGNLIDNAQKYSRDAADPRIILRARQEEGHTLLEVEDHGPGVAKREKCSIFRAFRRGRDADVKAGGVGLGLALSTRWAYLLGGKLTVQSGQDGMGACFRLTL
jgi:signal transduction histidine kinase